MPSLPSDGNAKWKRCWNCRARKTACDRTQPSCMNCQRRGIECLGYGLKLSWPRVNDGRRAAKGHRHHILPVQPGRVEFVNATSRDMELWSGTCPVHVHVPRAFHAVALGDMDPYMDNRKYSPVARIISSACDGMSELYGLLVRMSLADESPAALAARHAMAALSCQHLGQQEAAVMHQTKSLAALQSTINRIGSGDLEAGQALRAMAASMLLNIFETLNFDGSPLSWAIFFCGCKKIVNLTHTPHATYEGDSALILDWIFYHDTLYKFSIRHWYPKQTQQVLLAAQKKVVSKAVFSPLRQIILHSTGCSLQLLDLLCQIVDAVLDREDPNHLGPEHLRTIRSLELRLDNLTQTLRVASTSTSENHELQLAELYRLAAKIYLLRMARGSPREDPVVVALVNKAMQLLQEEGVQPLARPWPMFVVALEARTDEERRLVSDVLTASLARRPLGNLPLVRRLIHAAWVRMDLAEDKGAVDLMDVYNAVVSGLRVPPSFT